MAWTPPDTQSRDFLQQIITRAREQVLSAFSDERHRIEREQAARGVFGGPVLTRCGTAAQSAIQGFVARVVPELLDALNDVCAGHPPPEAFEWLRTTVQAHVDGLVNGLGGQIDGLKTGAGVKGAASRLDPARLTAQRDMDIEIGRAALRYRAATPSPTRTPIHDGRTGGTTPMYSLLMSSTDSAWAGAPWTLDRDRFLEYTDEEVKHQLGDFSDSALARLVRLPCIFAYEGIFKKDPLFGVVRRVVPRARDLRVEYEILSVASFLSQESFEGLAPALNIDRTEYFRMHWAVKEVDLGRVLATDGITLPPRGRWQHPVNVTNHHFDVGLSFPGEVRDFVKQVAELLDDTLGPDRYFYDDNYEAQLAQPDLDLLLQDIYRNRSRLVVVFLSDAYERKPWCAGVEFRAIRDIIKGRDRQRVMFIRMDDGAVQGVFGLDGAIDARKHSPSEIATMIKQRVDLMGLRNDFPISPE